MSVRSGLIAAANARPRLLSQRTLVTIGTGVATGVLFLTPLPRGRRPAQDGEETLFNMVMMSAPPTMLDPGENREDSAGHARHRCGAADHGHARVPERGRATFILRVGAMLARGRQFFLGAWWLTGVPELAIFLTDLIFNTAGERLRNHWGLGD